MSRKKHKPHWEMTTDELAESTKEFEKEFVPTHPLTRGMKEVLRRARKKLGRPTVGKGSQRVLITIERDLLRRVDAFARAQKLSRSQLIARSLEAAMNR